MSYNPFPQPADIVVVSAGETVTEVNRFPVSIGNTGFVSLRQDGTSVSFDNPLPVSLGSSNITITGDVNVGTVVSVTSSPENPVHTHITEVGSSGILQDQGIPYMPVGISTLKNIVSVSNTAFYVTGVGSTVNVSGTVSVGNTVSISNTSFYVTGVGSTVNVSGTVSVGNTVSISNTSFYVNGVGSTVNVSGTVSIGNTVSISNTSFYVTGVGSTVNVSGTVSVGNTVTVNQGTSPWVVTPSGGSTPISFPDASVTAFDEPIAVSITPIMQADAVYGGLDPDFWSTTTLNGGTVGVSTDTGIWSVGCTTTTNSYARLYTTRYARYQPGQGMLFRWTAAYTTGVGTGRTTATGIDGIPQVSGPIDREDGYTFGFSGVASTTGRQFGIQHRRAGKVEIRQLTITTAAAGIQTATVTLNGVAYNIPLTAAPGGSTGYTASQIAVGLKTTTAAQYWQIDACSSVVTLAYFSPGSVNGTFSFSSSGSGTLAAGSFNRLVVGASPVDEWIYQDQWDNKTIQFDPTKLNVYSVDFRWLGAGIVRYFMEDPDTGKMTLVHTQHWTKNQTGIYPHINKPSLRVAYRVGSFAGGTASIPVTIRGSSIFAAVQGNINQTGSSQGWYNLDSTTRVKDTTWHLLTIQNPWVRNNTINKSQLVIQNLTVAAQSTDPSIIFLVKNAVGTSDLLVYNQIPGHGNPNVFAQYSTSSVSENLALDNVANVQTLGINGSSTFDLIPYNFILAPGDTISVFIRSTNAITNSAVGITWKVD